MTQEEKDKLFKYLCMALPYEVKCQFEDTIRITDGKSDPYYNYKLGVRHLDLFINHTNFYIKPYLRPMSSMTEEEKEEFEIIENTHEIIREHYSLYVYQHGTCIELINWLLAQHFDFMGLIPIDLAIQVTEENNPYKD